MRVAAAVLALVLTGGLGGLGAPQGLPHAGPGEPDLGVEAPEPPPSPPAETPGGLKTGADGNSLEASGLEVTTGGARAPGGVPVRYQAPPLTDYLHAEICGVFSAGRDAAWPCSDGRALDHSDVCGAAPVILPLWMRTRTGPAAAWGEWALLRDVTCDGGPNPSADQVLAAFVRLPLAPSVLHVQPDRGWVLVNKDTIAYVDAAPQTLTATVLGVGVTFVATPATYIWDYGERRLTTTSPGHPQPRPGRRLRLPGARHRERERAHHLAGDLHH